nr:uncharacterized protein LOC109173786 [Ipomoea batatas]
MRSFPVSARPPAPAKKISLGSKKAEPSKPADSTGEAPVPTGLPLTDATRATKRGKEKEVLEVEEVAIVKRSRRDGSGSTTPVIDVLMKHGDESPAALLTRICATAAPPEKTRGWSTALVGERIARDLIQIPSFWPSISAEDGRLGRPFLREIGHLTLEVSTLLSPSRSEDR